MAENRKEPDLEQPSSPSFGEDLRREREMREVSIREISESTKISTRFLEAIENGDFSSLPAPVFTRGFIREYASYLGLDSRDLVDRYMSVVANEEKRLQNEEAEMRERISGRFAIGSGSAWKWVIMAVIAVIVLAGAVYFVSRSGESVPAESASEPQETVVEEPVRSQEPVATADTIEMTLSATADSWVNLQIDGQPPIDFTLQSGSSRDFQANEKIVLLTVGNAGGVNVVLNGVEIEPLGRVDQVVRDVEFDLERVNDLLQAEESEPGNEPE